MNRSALLYSLTAPLVASALPRIASAADAEPMRVAYQTIDATTSFWTAIENGYFAKAGLNVAAEPMNGTAATASAGVMAGSLTSVGVSVVTLAKAHEKGLPLKYISLDSVYTSTAPSSALLVEKDSPVKSARDLNGKVIAVNTLSGLAYLAVLAWVDKNGGDAKSLKFTEMPFDTMPVALTAHRVDAALVAEPALTQAKADARVLGDAYTAIAPRFLIDGWVASTSWIAAHPADAAKFRKAVREGAVWANRNRDGSAIIAAKYTKAEVATIRSMNRAVFADEERNVTALIQPVIDVAAKYGVLTAAFPAADLLSREAFG